MKMNLNKGLNLMIIIFLSGLILSCKEQAPEPVKKQEPVVVKKVKPSIDSSRKKEITSPLPLKEPEPKTYVVKSGEWLWDIARKEYGTPIGWFRIYEANRHKIRNPELIYPGQSFIIPDFKRK